MIKEEIIVPKSIKYLTEWTDFINNIKELPCILDKSVTGCGFTEWCITNNMNIILCSPRKILLENKESQHIGEVFYFRNDSEKPLDFDKDLEDLDSKKKLNSQINYDSVNEKLDLTPLQNNVIDYYQFCLHNSKPCKILVTYDSFKYVKSALGDNINNFLVVVDEFQSIFIDAKFKPTTELKFLYYLQGLAKIIFVSATIEDSDCLEQLDEFKNLPYYILNWEKENPLRTIKACVNPYRLLNHSIQWKVSEIVEEYRSGRSEELKMPDGSVIKSKEAVFYINSVKNICNIIRKADLKPEECNILCANTIENINKIKEAFGLKKEESLEIGKVPRYGEIHKMFTFCTRTVYLGADFYSTNAKTYIFSDANIESMVVDITLDLPQIMGRQRLSCNPWKNIADLYYKTTNKISNEEYEKFILNKKQKSCEVLAIYNESQKKLSEKNSLVEILAREAKNYNYKYNYIAVDDFSNKGIITPVFNKLVLLSEIRAFKIQSIDYRDRFSLFNSISEKFNMISSTSSINSILCQFDLLNSFYEKMKLIINSNLSKDELVFVLNQIPTEYLNYINILGIDKIKALGFNKTKCDSEILNLSHKNLEKTEFTSLFPINEKFTKNYIKATLQSFYNKNNIKKTAKASDLFNYFELKPCKIKINDKWEHGFQIIGLKKED